MTPGAPATVVWIDRGGDADADRAAARLGAWARARGIELRGFEPDTSAPEPAPSSAEIGALASSVETSLSAARDGLAAADALATDRALLAAEATVRAHPELPQAAWLRAEVERAWATRWTRLAPIDPERAALALARGRALDGGRAPGIGEPADTSAPDPRDVAMTLEVDSAGRDVVVVLDGREVPARGVLRRPPGEHQLLVTSASSRAVLYAAWVGVDEGTTVALHLAAPVPCSAEDLAPDHRDRAACPRWVRARTSPRAPDELLVATCTAAVCSPESSFRAPSAPSTAPSRDAHDAETHAKHIPAWLGVAAVAVSVVGLGAAAVWASGALASPQHESRFVVGGMTSTAIPTH